MTVSLKASKRNALDYLTPEDEERDQRRKKREHRCRTHDTVVDGKQTIELLESELKRVQRLIVENDYRPDERGPRIQERENRQSTQRGAKQPRNKSQHDTGFRKPVNPGCIQHFVRHARLHILPHKKDAYTEHQIRQYEPGDSADKSQAVHL